MTLFYRMATIVVALWLSSSQEMSTTTALRSQNTSYFGSTKTAKKSSVFRHWYRQLDHQGDESVTQNMVFPNLSSSLKPAKATEQQQQQSRASAPTSSLYTSSSSMSLPRDGDNDRTLKQGRRSRTKKHVVSCAHELRRLILDENVALRDIEVQIPTSKNPHSNDFAHPINHDVAPSQLQNHDVLQLITRRYREKSKPLQRCRGDTARLALSLEGGGMRGVVSAGMATAISFLGLQDTFDVIYGSSAGSCVGAYLVSQQLLESRDVYSEILTAARRRFVCKYRILFGLAATAVDWIFSRLETTAPNFSSSATPGMNLSYILDHVMHPEDGLRPLDLESFVKNDQRQPLRIVSSYVNSRDGELSTRCFGTADFLAASCPRNARDGIYACLEASMTVPGATGPPVSITTSNETHSYFDAFCFQPLPYRSAVEEGATHVLVLCTRPACHQPDTNPGLYERAVAPLYFESHGDKSTSKFFAAGGQQYLYAEDLLTLEEGKRAGLSQSSHLQSQGVLVPPPRILFGVDRSDRPPTEEERRKEWKRAHLLPLKVPAGTPELDTLEQDRKQVLEAVRGGFAAAYDLLAPITIGVKVRTGREVAETIFPDESNEVEEVGHRLKSKRGIPAVSTVS
jgi:predicted patatin/cPLA2 family phospholipase